MDRLTAAEIAAIENTEQSELAERILTVLNLLYAMYDGQAVTLTREQATLALYLILSTYE